MSSLAEKYAAIEKHDRVDPPLARRDENILGILEIKSSILINLENNCKL